ncbi:uncharacterized protein METZ01_LOCUS102220, partial [marine metagenome]
WSPGWSQTTPRLSRVRSTRSMADDWHDCPCP